MNKPGYYAIIPADIRYDKDLSPNAKLLYGEITALSNENGYCWANNIYFAELYNVSIRSVQNWITQLEKKEHIYPIFIYKDEDKKEIESRRIYIKKPQMNEFMTPRKKLHRVVKKNTKTPCKKFHTPHEKNFTYNNTDFNITSINNISLKEREKIEQFAEELANQNGNNPLAYKTTLLKNWDELGLTTLEEIKQQIKPTKPKGRILSTPGWLNENEHTRQKMHSETDLEKIKQMKELQNKILGDRQ